MAAAFHNTFRRIEKKYPVSAEKYEALRRQLETHMRVDQYGESQICNVYYDTPQSSLISLSIDRPREAAYKEKLRVRSYGVPGPEDKVYVEIKKKYDGVVYKRRAVMTLKQQEDYLLRGIRPVGIGQEQILSEIDYFKEKYPIAPMLMIAYKRTALYGIEDPSFRVTFDRDICYRRERLSLGNGLADAHPLHMCCYRLMEIKAGGAMPLWMARLLSELEIYPHSFSKYGNIYKEEHHMLQLFMHDY